MGAYRRFNLNVSSAAFAGMHLAALLVVLVPFAWPLLALLAGSYLLRMFAVTAGYHRYFSHRAFRLNRFWQVLLAFLAQSTGQKGVLWWAAHHREHHRTSDTESDIHSPTRRGFWWSHMGWVLSDAYDRYDPKGIQDFGKFPELRFLDRHHWVAPWTFGVLAFLGGLFTGLGGWAALLYAFVVPTVLLWHATFTINSLAHAWGWRRFETRDTSRNNLFLAFLTLGEGWHNNHHAVPGACRQGYRWWEVDLTYYGLLALRAAGIVKDIRPWPSQPRLEGAP